MTAATSVTARQIVPNADLSVDVMTYNKNSATDYLTLSVVVSSSTQNESLSRIRTLYFAHSTDDTAGANDPVTYSSATITWVGTGSLTGDGRVLIIGKC